MPVLFPHACANNSRGVRENLDPTLEFALKLLILVLITLTSCVSSVVAIPYKFVRVVWAFGETAVI